jgi:hypothetical protein
MTRKPQISNGRPDVFRLVSLRSWYSMSLITLLVKHHGTSSEHVAVT